MLDHPRDRRQVGIANNLMRAGFTFAPWAFDALVGPMFWLSALDRTRQVPASPGSVLSPERHALRGRLPNAATAIVRNLRRPTRRGEASRRRPCQGRDGGEENRMSTDVELLAKKVDKHQAKLQEHTTLLEMTEKRAATADQDRQAAAREADRLKKRAKQAKQEARRLAREAKRAHLRLEAGEADHDQAEKELRELGKLVAKRRDKLAKAEAAHAAAAGGAACDGHRIADQGPVVPQVRQPSAYRVLCHQQAGVDRREEDHHQAHHATRTTKK